MSVSAGTATAAGIAGCALLSGVFLFAQPEGPTRPGTAVQVSLPKEDEDDDLLHRLIPLLLGVLALCVISVAFCRRGSTPPPPSPRKAAPAAAGKPPPAPAASNAAAAAFSNNLLDEPAVELNEITVTVVEATGLEGVMKFTADQPYVYCMKVGAHVGAKPPSFWTKPVKEKTKPVWNEEHRIAPWAPGENLEFTIYSKGLLNSKTVGKGTLKSGEFFPTGFDGEIPIVSDRIPTNSNPSGNAQNATLHVIVKCPPDSKHLPEGWESTVDEVSGKVYYYNHDTQVSQWEFPPV